MSRSPRFPRRFVTVAGLTGLWCGLWRDVSVANLLVGLGVAVLVSGPLIGSDGRGGVRPLALLRLGLVVLVDLARSTVGVAREILIPEDRTDEAIVAIDLPPAGHRHLLFLTVAITLTPGTAVVDVDRDRHRLYLHLLHADRRDDAVAHARRLAELAEEALPTSPTANRAGGRAEQFEEVGT